jgi:anti-sigma regulatory factor (Ser/Thr protein kinase)
MLAVMGHDKVMGHARHLRMPATPESVRDARHRVADFAAEMCFSQEDTDALALAVGEACNNAVNYGSRASASPVVMVDCTETDRDEVQVDVTNAGNDFHPDLSAIFLLPAQETFSSHGRGFALMSALVDEVKIMSDGASTTVRLVKRKSK